jgi:hypothetical protein
MSWESFTPTFQWQNVAPSLFGESSSGLVLSSLLVERLSLQQIVLGKPGDIRAAADIEGILTAQSAIFHLPIYITEVTTDISIVGDLTINGMLFYDSGGASGNYTDPAGAVDTIGFVTNSQEYVGSLTWTGNGGAVSTFTVTIIYNNPRNLADPPQIYFAFPTAANAAAWKIGGSYGLESYDENGFTIEMVGDGATTTFEVGTYYFNYIV